MMRKFITLLLAGSCGWVLAAQAADAPAATTGNATASAQTATSIPDNQVPRYLSSAQRAQWEDAQKKVIEGNGMIKDGQFLQIKPDAGAVILDPAALAASQKQGKQEQTDGEKMVRDANAVLATLRNAALQNYNKAPVEVKNTAPANYTMPLGQWPDVIQGMSEKIYGALAADGYKRVYLASVYNFDEPRYSPKFEAAEQIRQIFINLDRGKGIFVPQHDWSFRIGLQSGNLTLTYPDRAANEKSGLRSAMVLGEILYESNGFATFSLRAVDLDNWRIIANQTMFLSVEPVLGKSLGLLAFQVLSRHEAPPAPAAPAPAAPAATSAPATTAPSATMATAAPSPASTPASAITIALQDTNNGLTEYRDAPRDFILRFTNTGGATLENRAATVALKSYLRDQIPGLMLNDYDFLVLALSSDAPSSATPSAAQANTIWQLASVIDLDTSPLEIGLKSRNVPGGTTDTDIGKIVIGRTLPKLTRPLPEELSAAGYSIGGK